MQWVCVKMLLTFPVSLSLSLYPFKRLTYVNKLAVLMLYPFICLTNSQVVLISICLKSFTFSGYQFNNWWVLFEDNSVLPHYLDNMVIVPFFFPRKGQPSVQRILLGIPHLFVYFCFFTKDNQVINLEKQKMQRFNFHTYLNIPITISNNK